MSARKECQAIVRLDWSSYRCTKNATQERLGRPVCGTHARQYDKWEQENRGPLMARSWWKWETA